MVTDRPTVSAEQSPRRDRNIEQISNVKRRLVDRVSE